MNKSKLIIISTLSILASSCTISMTNISTEGTASDVVDETSSTSATVNPDISIPAVGL